MILDESYEHVKTMQLSLDELKGFDIRKEIDEEMWNPNYRRFHFLCPICKKKTLITEAVHHSIETGRKLIAISDDKETWQVTYRNIRICKECKREIRKGNLLAFLLWLVIGVVFYAIFAYVYFDTDDLLCSNYVFGSLYERNDWSFFFISLGLTVFGSWLVLLLCFCFCSKWYKNEGSLFSLDNEDTLWFAELGNAIAPMEEKDI